MGMADNFIKSYEGGYGQGRDQMVTKRFGDFAPKARGGDKSAWDELYAADPAKAAAFEQHLGTLDAADQKDIHWVQEQAGQLAYGVLQEKDPAMLGQRLMQSIDQLEGMVQGKRIGATMKPTLEKMRQLAASNDPQAIADQMNETLSHSMSVADRMKLQAPKTETERYWNIINAGDPSSAAYAQAHYELFDKPQFNVDPVTGQMMPRPKGEAPPGVRPVAGAPGAPTPVSVQELPPPSAPPPRRFDPNAIPPGGDLPPAQQMEPGTTAPFGSFTAPTAPPNAAADLRPQASTATLPGTDAFKNPVGTTPYAERRDNNKIAYKTYTEGQKANKEALDKANTNKQLATRFLGLNDKVNAKGSGSPGTGGVMAFPLAGTFMSAFDKDISTMNSIVAGLVPQQRVAGSGATSDFDAGMFQRGLFGVDKPWGTNKALALALVAQAQNTIDYVDFYDTYFKANGNVDAIDSSWQRYINANKIFDEASPDDPKLNPNRQSWQQYFGIDPTKRPEPTPQTKTAPNALSPDVIKKNPSRFVPLN